MSDISLHITWIDLILAAPIFGWPGLILGGIIGALLWKKRRFLGAALAGILGSFVWFLARIYFK